MAESALGRVGAKMSRGPIRKSYALVVEGRRGRWLILMALAILVSVMEAAGAGLVFVLIGLVTEPEAGIDLPLVGDVSEFFPDLDRTELFIYTAIVIGVFFLVRAAVLVVQTYAQHRITYNAGARLGSRLVRGYLAMPYEYHLGHDTPELVRNAVVSVQEVVNRVVLPSTKFVAELLVAMGLTAVLMFTAPIASLLVVVALGPATYLVLRLVRSRVRQSGLIATQAARETLKTLQSSLHGIRDIRLLGRERQFMKRFRHERRRDASAKARQATYSQLSSVLIETILILFIVMFVAATVVFSGTASRSFAVLGLFAYIGMRLKPSIQKMINTANNVRYASPAIDDLYQDLTDTEQALIAQAQLGSDPDGETASLEKAIEVRHVSFKYPGSDYPALDDVTITIGAGESLGICGPTGGGKSTLADLIAGLVEPTSGSVLVDGVDIRRDLRAWYSQLGVVSQTPYMFDDTIRRNVALGLPEQEIDDAAVRRALEIAQIAGFVDTLPAGEQTYVGEQGILLSGGQRQRIAIARALYRDPSVLILDEGTSALDNETERKFVAAIEALRGDKTIILIAHRLTTIRRCDRVVFVSDGRVAGGGSYEELYEQNASFREMAM